MAAESKSETKRGRKPATEKAKPAKETVAAASHPKIRKLIVKNFRCIGQKGVTVTLDEIVVLVGANNTGKSAVLEAYEIALRSGEKAAELNIEDFPCHQIPDKKAEHLWPEIILETVVTEETKPSDKWICYDKDNSEHYVRERWRWNQPGKASHVAFNVQIGDWAENEDQKVPWGFEGVAKPKRPEPLRLSPFDSPEKIEETLAKLLKNPLKDRMGQTDTTGWGQLVTLYQELVQAASSEVGEVTTAMTRIVSRVFPEHMVRFDPPHEVNLRQKILDFVPTILPKLSLGFGEHFSPLEKQGSGAQRMIMWAALRSTAEQKQLGKAKEKDIATMKSYLLLIDEPELCLHPTAVRHACKILQEIAALPNWQVMITTHSPVFIDLRSNNTSIVRVDRDNRSKGIGGTTIYRPASANLDPDDHKNLTMLTAFDPYVAEFFFAKNIVVVEGDTEYVALQTTISLLNEDRYSDVHIIRARGKSCIPTICKILNQFKTRYAVLHDSDRPKKADKTINGRWTDNDNIRKAANANAVVVAMIPNFEKALRRIEQVDEDRKPYEAFVELTSEGGTELLGRMQMLLDFLIGEDDVTPKSLPEFCISWTDLRDLEEAYAQFMPQYVKQNRQTTFPYIIEANPQT